MHQHGTGTGSACQSLPAPLSQTAFSGWFCLSLPQTRHLFFLEREDDVHFRTDFFKRKNVHILDIGYCMGFPIDTHVTLNSFPSISTGSVLKISLSLFTGIFSGFNIGSPYQLLQVWPFHLAQSVQELYSCQRLYSYNIFIRHSRSNTYFPTHLIAFPHISASEPSELNILILKSPSLKALSVQVRRNQCQNACR